MRRPAALTLMPRGARTTAATMIAPTEIALPNPIPITVTARLMGMYVASHSSSTAPDE